MGLFSCCRGLVCPEGNTVRIKVFSHVTQWSKSRYILNISVCSVSLTWVCAALRWMSVFGHSIDLFLLFLPCVNLVLQSLQSSPGMLWVKVFLCPRDKAGHIRVQDHWGIQVEPLVFGRDLFAIYICRPSPLYQFPVIRWYDPSCDTTPSDCFTAVITCGSTALIALWLRMTTIF